MNENSDAQLLRQFAEHGRADAFREIVTRHADFVYSAALRQVESPDLASDLSQNVFVDLARKARQLELPDNASLAGWLHRSTRYAALNHWRATQRRRTNERLAMEQLLTDSEPAVNWEQIRPALDEALDALSDDDREALLLRYFKNLDFRAVGLALGVSDDTAQKRVSRALERLREFFSQRNVTIGASGLAILISANAVQSATLGLAATISAAAVLAGTTVSTSAVIAATKTIAMTTFQKTLITAAFVAITGAGFFEAHQATQLRTQNQIFQQQQSSFDDQLGQLQQALNDATNRLANVIAENEQLKSSSNRMEILKLRGQAALLFNQANDPFVQEALKWKASEEKLKQLFAEHPEQRIPQMQLLSEQQWLDIARNEDLESTNGIRKALSEIRRTAENNFMPALMGALKSYVNANNGMLPDNVSDLTSYFSAPVDDAMLEQYKMLYTGKASDVSGNGFAITEKQVVDPEYDDPWTVGPNGYGPDVAAKETPIITSNIETLKPVIQAFMTSNNGSQPASLDQLKSFISTPDQQAAFDNLNKDGGVNFGQPK